MVDIDKGRGQGDGLFHCESIFTVRKCPIVAVRWQIHRDDDVDGVVCLEERATGDERRGGWSTLTRGGDRGRDHGNASLFLLSVSVPSSRCDGELTATTMALC